MAESFLDGRRLCSSLGSPAKSLMTLATKLLPGSDFSICEMGWMALIHFLHGCASNQYGQPVIFSYPLLGWLRSPAGTLQNGPGSVPPLPHTKYADLSHIVHRPAHLLLRGRTHEGSVLWVHPKLWLQHLERHCVLCCWLIKQPAVSYKKLQWDKSTIKYSCPLFHFTERFKHPD